MLCPKCNSELDDAAVVCPSCGEQIHTDAPHEEVKSPSKISLFLKKLGISDWAAFVLGLMVPLAGVALFIIYHKKKADLAKSCLIGAIIGSLLYLIFAVGVVLLYVMFVLLLLLAAAVLSALIF